MNRKYYCDLGLCKSASEVQTPGTTYYPDPRCSGACHSFFYCNNQGRCVREQSSIKGDALYYVNDPYCNMSCGQPQFNPLGYYYHCGLHGCYAAPFPRRRNWRWRK